MEVLWTLSNHHFQPQRFISSGVSHGTLHFKNL
jgi:hypothetical protein